MILTSTRRSGWAIEWPGDSAGKARALDPTDPIANANKALLTMIISESFPKLVLCQIHTKFFVCRPDPIGSAATDQADGKPQS
jgi:hypothetical protein